MLRRIALVVTMLASQTMMAQEIVFNQKAALEQVYKKAIDAENLLPMNDLNVEFGYVLYQSEITTQSESEELELENVRDYAAVYVDGKLQGKMTDNNKKVAIKTNPGKYLLQIYVENIGRITYGPEITDNSKGLFGEIKLDGNEVENWKMVPLNIKKYPIKQLTFENRSETEIPSFYKGTFELNTLKNNYLDVTGWGMGEVWVNQKYVGSYWEEEKQRSILIPSEDLVQGENEIVVFELKNNQQKTMKLSQTPVFK
ncbi:Beta-galactosidase precursor [compost metagenome]